MKLAELQALFQAGVLAGENMEDAAVLDALAASERTDRATLFGVYVNAYRVRLGEFLNEDYPALRVLLGDDAFDALVEHYIAANPSRHRNARWYTSRLPDFLQDSETWRGDARAISLALFERALTDAFDAAETDALALDALASFSPERRPRLTFAFHPSLILLELAAGTVASFEAATAEEVQELPAPQTYMNESGRETVAVWRSDGDPAYRELEQDEFLALNEARAGRAFGDICQMAAFQQGEALTPERLAQCLGSWFTEGLVAAVRDDGADTLSQGEGAGPKDRGEG